MVAGSAPGRLARHGEGREIDVAADRSPAARGRRGRRTARSPAISRLVAIGRRMKISEKFTPSPLLARASLARPLPAAARPAAVRGPVPCVPGARRSWPSVTTVSPGFQALLDHHVLIDARAGRHRPRFHRAVLLHHVDELPVLAGLHGLSSAPPPRSAAWSAAASRARTGRATACGPRWGRCPSA